MTFERGQANRPVTSGLDTGRSLHEVAAALRGPVRVPQGADPLNYDQRELDHAMRCRKVGCTRCSV